VPHSLDSGEAAVRFRLRVVVQVVRVRFMVRRVRGLWWRVRTWTTSRPKATVHTCLDCLALSVLYVTVNLALTVLYVPHSLDSGGWCHQTGENKSTETTFEPRRHILRPGRRRVQRPRCTRATCVRRLGFVRTVSGRARLGREHKSFM